MAALFSFGITRLTLVIDRLEQARSHEIKNLWMPLCDLMGVSVLVESLRCTKKCSVF